MLPTSSSPADFFIAEEVCPLCLQHYATVDECTCVVCAAPSCPGCAELLDTSGAMRCYACAPVANVTHQPGRELDSPVREAAYAFGRWRDALHGSAGWLKASAGALIRRVLSRPSPLVGSVKRSRALDFAPR